MYETLFRNVLFPLYEGPIKRRYTHRYLADYERTQWLGPVELEALQLRKLNDLVDHCWRNVPFLQAHWRGAGLRPGALSRVADLGHFPTLTKQHIRDNYDAMRSRVVTGRVFTKATGGSTGDPFQFQYSEEVYARRTAVMWRGYRWAGTDIGRSTAYVWGAAMQAEGLRGIKDALYQRAFNRVVLNSFALSEKTLPDYIRRLNAFAPRIVVGYVAPLAEIARRALGDGLALHRPEAVITGAESLSSDERTQIETAFQAPVFETYGCREVMLLGCQCERREAMHISADHLIVETLLSDGRDGIGEPGEVCITDLHNFAMPLFRYINGDLAVRSGRPCACGRGLPLLNSVEGRTLDMIRTADGQIVPGEFFVHSMLAYPFVERFQVIQHDAMTIELKLVNAAPLTDAQRDSLIATLRLALGPGCRITLTQVAEIPLTASGKRRVTLSHVGRASHGVAA
jgi:phenylacetate-coenzyme A ligase PaaK-like adenylate-forming protein